MKTLKIVMGIVAILVNMPISFYLQYKILAMVNATDVMWLLFWVNLPLLILFQIISKIAESTGD